MIKVSFWLSIILIIYAYFGYPSLILLLAKIYRQNLKKANFIPRVSFITVAYNEESCIKEKIENSLSIDYPKDKLEIIIASDGSTDNTDCIISQYKNCSIKFLRFDKRRGKASCLNDAVFDSKGEILVFSDANVFYEKDAIKKLVRNFNDSRVGAVTGEVHYVLDKDSTNKGEGLFTKYENFIKRHESNFYSLIGVDGAMYAIRRELYAPLKKDIITDDLFIALNVVQKGYRVIYEPEAQGVEIIFTSTKDEFKRKVRMIAGGYQTFRELKWMMRGFPFSVVFEFISHKLMRWLAPFFILGVLIINVSLLNFKIYQLLLSLQILFYIAVILGYILEKQKIKSPFSFLYYFTAVNFASLCGLFRFLTGTQKVTWSRVHRAQDRI